MHKLIHPMSFKISDPMKQRILEECAKEHRSEVDLGRILMAEALVLRDAQEKGNTKKYV